MAANIEVMKQINTLIKNNPDATATYDSLRQRGLTDKEASEEIACLFIACMWHAWRDANAPEANLAAMLELVKGGKWVRDIFPDDDEDATQ